MINNNNKYMSDDHDYNDCSDKVCGDINHKNKK